MKNTSNIPNTSLVARDENTTIKSLNKQKNNSIFSDLNCNYSTNDNLQNNSAPLVSSDDATALESVSFAKYETDLTSRHTAASVTSKQNCFNGGASIDVSPNGSWLAWFKRLPAPSPVSVKRKEAPTDRDFTGEEETTLSSRQNSSYCEAQSADCENLCSDSKSYNVSQSTRGSRSQVPSPIKRKWNKIKTPNFISRLYTKIVNKVKKHPYVSTLVIVLFFFVVISIVMILVFWLIPWKIQDTMNESQITMIKSVLNSPTSNSFDIYTETLLKRPNGYSVAIESFDANVFYVSSFLDLPPQQRSLLEETSSLELHDVLDYQMIRGKALDEIETKEDTNIAPEEILIGQMTIPNTPLQGKESIMSYSTQFRVLNPQVFESFLREFMMKGSAQWRMKGNPSVRLLGVSYPNIQFDKVLNFNGPKLFHTYEDLWKLIKVSKKTKQSHVVQNDQEEEWWNSIFGSEFPKKDKSSSTVVSSQELSRPFEIREFDLTHSTPTEARIHVKVGLNVESGISIDPIGTIVLAQIYHNEPLVELTSAEQVSLKPGYNEINLYGIFEDSRNTPLEKRESIAKMLSTLFQGESPILETKGLDSSIPLYAPAVQSIKVYSLLKLGSTTAPVQLPPIIKSLDVESIQIGPNGDDDDSIVFEGQVLVIINNPFGHRGTFFTPEISVAGIASFDMSIEKWPYYEKKNVTFFEGKLEGLQRSQPVISKEGELPQYGQLGIMRVSEQSLPVKFNVKSKLLERGQGLRYFIKQYFSSENITLSFDDVQSTISLIDTPLGSLKLNQIPLSKDFSMSGVKSKIKLKNIDFGSPNVEEESEVNEGFYLRCDFEVPYDVKLTSLLGQIVLSIKLKSQHMANVVLSNSKINLSDGLLTLTASTKLLNMNVGMIYSLAVNYAAGKSTSLEIQFIDPQTFTNEAVKITKIQWFQKALLHLEFIVPFSSMFPIGSEEGNKQGIFNVIMSIFPKLKKLGSKTTKQ